MKEASLTIANNLLYSKSAVLNVNFIQNKTFTESSRIMFDHLSGHHGHKISHHTWHTLNDACIILSSFCLLSALSHSKLKREEYLLPDGTEGPNAKGVPETVE